MFGGNSSRGHGKTKKQPASAEKTYDFRHYFDIYIQGGPKK